MGQYQQWLYFHEVDRHLQAQLEELVSELAQLRERAHLYEQILPSQPPYEHTSTGEIHSARLDNAILHALANHLNGHIPANGQAIEESTTTFRSYSEIIPGESPNTISSALFAQGNLPNFDTPTTSPVPTDISEGNTSPFPSSIDQSPSSIPHYDMALLPEDMVSFFDQHSATDPQLELPWWLRNLTTVSNANGPIDQESIRTNRLIQRWLERWGKQPSQPPQPPQPPQSQKSEGNQS